MAIQTVDVIPARVGLTPGAHTRPPIAHAWLPMLPHLVSSFSVVVGLLTLAGWIFDVATLKALAAPMKANTAFGLVVAGLGLALRQPRGRNRLGRVSALACASVVILLGVATLGQDVFGWQLGIDQLLARDVSHVGHFAGRMAPSTAVALVLLGATLMLLDFEGPGGVRPAELLGAAAGLNSILVLAGYVYGIDFYQPTERIEMATVTALACGALAAGTLASRPDRGVVAAVLGARSRLATRIVLLVLAAVLVSGGVVSGLLIDQSRRGLQTQIVAASLSAAELAADFAGTYVQQATLSVERFATRSTIIEAVESQNFASAVPEMKQFTGMNPQLTGLVLADVDGVIRASDVVSGPAAFSIADRDYFRHVLATHRAHLGTAVRSRMSDRLIIPFAVPIHGHDRPVGGVLVGGISVKTLGEALTSLRIGAGSRVSLLDAREGGRVLVHSDPAYVFSSVADRDGASARAIAGERGSMVSLDGDGRDQLAVFAPVSGVPWAILMAQPASAAFAPVRSAIQRGLAVMALLLILAALSGTWLARHVTRPLAHLRAVADAFAGGDLTQRLSWTRPDELGDLGRAFDHMAVTLATRTTQLETANRELNAFSYSVSHDLRTPLRAIDGFSRILLDKHGPQLAPDAQRYTRLIREGAQQMGRLIDDILAFSRLAGVPMSKRSVEPRELVLDCFDKLTADQRERRIDLTVGDLPACDADPALLRQVWMNLLSNAVKYTRGRTPAKIDVGHDESGGERAYYVRDNGVGFDMRYADKLFGVFQRLHRAEEFEGTGVGLAIVQRIVHRHGGRVWAVSAVDRGTTFYFRLSGGR